MQDFDGSTHKCSACTAEAVGEYGVMTGRKTTLIYYCRAHELEGLERAARLFRGRSSFAT